MMKKNNFAKIFVVIIMAILQLGLLSQTIIAYKNLKIAGYEHKFKLMPQDPVDHFRGRYLRLAYQNNLIQNDNIQDESSPSYHLTFREDEKGFAIAQKAYSLNEKPQNDNYLTVTLSSWVREGGFRIIYLPFERFYIQEEYAILADKYMRPIMEDKDVYAKIIIKDGKGRLMGVFIEEKPILDYLKESYKTLP